MIKYDYIPKTNIKMIHVDKSYSFGIDSILLANFAKMKKNTSLIDIGAGSGILSLASMAYYDLDKIYSIEIQEEKARLLEENLALNSISNIEVINKDLNKCEFKENYIDYIITNPPYYKKDHNIANKDYEFLVSRQEIAMTLEDIFDFSAKVLKDKGKLYMIHKPERLVDLIKLTSSLKLKRVKFVQSHIKSKPVFILCEFVKNAREGLKFEDTLVIYEDGKYSKEVNEINGL
ncbi:MAG: methyltransferase [Anaerococcus sp.]|nr:methyltransferase [Peptoniphilaceae bacterium]MDY3055792.1 methyltransferase [Anaerococcus sp.]